jgi:uncharacterized iron-regulated protein
MGYVKIILLSLFLSSCATKIPFTSDIQSEYKFPEERLKKVQFYTSAEIVLIKTKNEGDAVVNDGKILIKNEKNVEKIIIKQNTPCILEEIVEDNKFLFSFEYGKDRVLMFGNNSSGYYSLMAKSWKSQQGLIDYANKTYATTNGDVFLNIKVKNLKKLKGKQRTLKGRKI